MKAIYKFYWDCGRNGDVTGVFVSEKEQIEAAIGKKVYFGEILGKHSEVYGTLDRDDIKEITNNQEFVKMFEEYELSTGYNPLRYIEE